MLQYKVLFINNIPIFARVADNDSLREKGLMFVESLQSNEGCLLAFESDDYIRLWMKNCLCNLQTAFLDKDGTILEIVDMNYREPYVVHCSSQLARYALEMPHQFFTNNKISIHDKVSI